MPQTIVKLATTTYRDVVCNVPDELAVKVENGETFVLKPMMLGKLPATEWIHSTLALKLGLITLAEPIA